MRPHYVRHVDRVHAEGHESGGFARSNDDNSVNLRLALPAVPARLRCVGPPVTSNAERHLMVLHVLRTLFILLMGAVGWYYLQHPTQFLGHYTWTVMAFALVVGVAVVCVDIVSPRRKLAIFSGTLFGLVVGLLVAFGVSFVVKLIVEQQMPIPASIYDKPAKTEFLDRRGAIIEFVDVLVGVISSYLAISFILQTKDDFRFIVPFVEFAKERRGVRPMLVDTSVLIDGRIADIAATGIIESQLIIPRFVLEELQLIADSGDRLKRNRGRRGLDVLAKLQQNRKVEVVLWEGAPQDEQLATDVDTKLTMLGKELSARVLTTDFNLNKVATLRSVDVININQLALAVKPIVLPGEKMFVRIAKAGDQPGQGVGFLEDGTMVVIEHGRSHVNEEVEFTVTSSLQNNTGKMIFGRLVADGGPPPPTPPLDPMPPTKPLSQIKPSAPPPKSKAS